MSVRKLALLYYVLGLFCPIITKRTVHSFLSSYHKCIHRPFHSLCVGLLSRRDNAAVILSGVFAVMSQSRMKNLRVRQILLFRSHKTKVGLRAIAHRCTWKAETVVARVLGISHLKKILSSRKISLQLEIFLCYICDTKITMVFTAIATAYAKFNPFKVN